MLFTIPISWEYIISYICMVVMTVTTAVSGYDYIKSYWKYVDSNK